MRLVTRGCLTVSVGLVAYVSVAVFVLYDRDTLEAKWKTIHEFHRNTYRALAAGFGDVDTTKNGMPITLPRICDNAYAHECGMSAIFHDLRSALDHQASKEGVVFLAGLVDGGYVDFAVNLHTMSIAPHDICNILYIAIDETTLNKTQQYNMPVYYHNISIANKAVGKFHSAAFIEKSKIKLRIVEMALQMGYTVLLTDLDVFFRSNPLPYIDCGSDCDFAVQDGNYIKKPKIVQMNTGFIFLKSNERTIRFYGELLKKAPTYPDDDQVLFNKAFYLNSSAVKMVALPREQFCVGKKSEPKEVAECVVFHANFVSGLVAKKAKLKGHGMWGLGTPKSELYQCKMPLSAV